MKALCNSTPAFPYELKAVKYKVVSITAIEVVVVADYSRLILKKRCGQYKSVEFPPQLKCHVH